MTQGMMRKACGRGGVQSCASYTAALTPAETVLSGTGHGRLRRCYGLFVVPTALLIEPFLVLQCKPRIQIVHLCFLRQSRAPSCKKLSSARPRSPRRSGCA